ncbi:MAG: hypothetical protein E7124_02390 [Bacteroidales bacterium]|nr:hypothetical protein [Bacteroidales bacterium]
MMSLSICIAKVIGGMMVFMLPVGLSAQDYRDTDREKELHEDIEHLGRRAVRDRVITDEEREDLEAFVRDSLPESIGLKIRALEQIRDELDAQYAEMVRQSQKLFDEAAYIGRQMLPDRIYEPEDYESPEERRRRNETAAVAYAAIDKEELMKHVKTLPMKPWLMTTLRLLFGSGVNQRPERWDQIRVPQMGRLYYIILPGGQPDDSWRDAPPMAYDPHPDKHFRH